MCNRDDNCVTRALVSHIILNNNCWAFFLHFASNSHTKITTIHFSPSHCPLLCMSNPCIHQ